MGLERLERALKPCPFCGGKAKIRQLDASADRQHWHIECEGCGVAVDHEYHKDDEGWHKGKSGMDSWNERANERTPAEWSFEGDNYYCSACRNPAPVKTVRTGFGTTAMRANRTPFCPHCGAQMMGGAD